MATEKESGGDDDSDATQNSSEDLTHQLKSIFSGLITPLAFPNQKQGSQRGQQRSQDSDVLSALALLTGWRWLWTYAFTFVAIELYCCVMNGESFFGMLTEGALMSLREHQGLIIFLHICGGSTMWALGFIQIIFRKLRTGSYAWVHRVSGKLFLLCWFGIVAPTASYLALFISAGATQAHLMMTFASMVTLDTTAFASYYFWHAWDIGRRRKQGPESLVLHGKLMRLGLIFSMIQLTQRPFQLLGIMTHKFLVHLVDVSPESWSGLRWFVALSGTTLLDHHVILSLSLLFPYGMLLLPILDGPQSKIMRDILALQPNEEELLYGSDENANAWHIIAWRMRALLYIALRALVTRGWTEDPLQRATSSISGLAEHA